MKNYTQVKFTKSVKIQTDIKQNIHHKHQTQMSEVNPFDTAFLSNKQQKKLYVLVSSTIPSALSIPH